MLTGVAALALTNQLVLTAAEDPDAGIITQETVSPGAVGFLIFVLLGLGTFFLWRSMSKQLRRISIPGDTSGDAAAAGGVVERSPWTRSLPLSDSPSVTGEEPGGRAEGPGSGS